MCTYQIDALVAAQLAAILHGAGHGVSVWIWKMR
jgi:hypothetical protein